MCILLLKYDMFFVYSVLLENILKTNMVVDFYFQFIYCVGLLPQHYDTFAML